MHVAVRDSWTDERLDEFGKRMDERFDRVDKRFDDLRSEMEHEFGEVDRRFDEVDKRFEQVDKRLDRLADGVESVQRAIIFGAVTMSSVVGAGLIALISQG
jgi:archaellum component FlaC